MKNELKVGDIVKVVNWGYRYDTYTSWFDENNIKPSVASRYAYNFDLSEDKYYTDKDREFTIVAIGNHHPDKDTTIVLLETIDSSTYSNNRLFLIGVSGVRLSRVELTKKEALEFLESTMNCKVIIKG